MSKVIDYLKNRDSTGSSAVELTRAQRQANTNWREGVADAAKNNAAARAALKSAVAPVATPIVQNAVSGITGKIGSALTPKATVTPPVAKTKAVPMVGPNPAPTLPAGYEWAAPNNGGVSFSAGHTTRTIARPVGGFGVTAPVKHDRTSAPVAKTKLTPVIDDKMAVAPQKNIITPETRHLLDAEKARKESEQYKPELYRLGIEDAYTRYTGENIATGTLTRKRIEDKIAAVGREISDLEGRTSGNWAGRIGPASAELRAQMDADERELQRKRTLRDNLQALLDRLPEDFDQTGGVKFTDLAISYDDAADRYNKSMVAVTAMSDALAKSDMEEAARQWNAAQQYINEAQSNPTFRLEILSGAILAPERVVYADEYRRITGEDPTDALGRKTEGVGAGDLYRIWSDKVTEIDTQTLADASRKDKLLSEIASGMYSDKQVAAKQAEIDAIDARTAQSIAELDKIYDLYNRAADREAEVAVASGEYRYGTWADAILNAVALGWDQSEQGANVFKQSFNGEDAANQALERYYEVIGQEKYKVVYDNWLQRGLSGAMELIGQRANATFSMETGLAVTAAVGVALAVGNANPLLTPLPEEVATVPAAVMTGLRIGSAVRNVEIEGGLAYVEMREAGIDHNTALPVALVVGGVNGAIETLQLDGLIEGATKVVKSGEHTDLLGKILAIMYNRLIEFPLPEAEQELLQEGVTIAGTELASRLSLGKGAYSPKEILERCLETFGSSYLTFVLSGAPGGLFSTHKGNEGLIPAIVIHNVEKKAAEASKLVQKRLAETQKFMEQSRAKMSETVKLEGEAAAIASYMQTTVNDKGDTLSQRAATVKAKVVQKVWSGEELTEEDVRKLDLSNPQMRIVFQTLTGVELPADAAQQIRSADGRKAVAQAIKEASAQRSIEDTYKAIQVVKEHVAEVESERAEPMEASVGAQRQTSVQNAQANGADGVVTIGEAQSSAQPAVAAPESAPTTDPVREEIARQLRGQYGDAITEQDIDAVYQQHVAQSQQAAPAQAAQTTEMGGVVANNTASDGVVTNTEASTRSTQSDGIKNVSAANASGDGVTSAQTQGVDTNAAPAYNNKVQRGAEQTPGKETATNDRQERRAVSDDRSGRESGESTRAPARGVREAAGGDQAQERAGTARSDARRASENRSVDERADRGDARAQEETRRAAERENLTDTTTHSVKLSGGRSVDVYTDDALKGVWKKVYDKFRRVGWKVQVTAQLIKVPSGGWANGVSFRTSALVYGFDSLWNTEKLGDHEFIHLLARNDPTAYQALVAKLEDSMPESRLDLMQQQYASLYGQTFDGGTSDDFKAYVMEEIVADTYAGMNRGGFGADAYQDVIRGDVDQWIEDEAEIESVVRDVKSKSADIEAIREKNVDAQDLEAESDPLDRASIKSYTEASGLIAERGDDGVIRFYVADKNGRRRKVERVTAQHIKAHSGIGAMITLAAKPVMNGDTVVRGATITQKEANEQYQAAADIMNMILRTNDPEMVWAWAGSNMFSAVRTNADGQYMTTVDFTTVCRKTQDMITSMSQMMMRRQAGLTREQIIRLQKKLDEAGSPVPCPVCYVFSRWAGVGGLLDNMRDWQRFYANRSEKYLADRRAELQIRLEKQVNDRLDFYNDELKRLRAENKAMRAEMKGAADQDRKATLRQKIAENNALIKPYAEQVRLLKNKDMQTLLHRLRLYDARSGLLASQLDQINAQNEDLIKVRDAESSTKKMKADARKQLNINKAKEKAIEDEMKVLKHDASPELVWLETVRMAPDYEEHGNVKMDVLYNLDAGDTFAKDYPLAWAYRTTRGPAMGKAILPYTDAKFGSFTLGAEPTDAEANAFKSGELGRDGRDAALTEDQYQVFLKALARTKAQNLIGGQRYQSTSDFRYEYALDYIMTFWEAQALGSNMQTYTKVAEFADLVAAVHGDVNLSVMPFSSGYVAVEVDGKKRKRLAFSNVTGLDYDTAVQVSNRYDNAQLILVGINDENIRLALDDEDAFAGGQTIGFVIPYHASGASITQFIKALVENLGETFDVSYYDDYANAQTDKVKDKATKDQVTRRDLRVKLLTGKDGNKDWTPTDADLDFIRGENKDITGMGFEDLRKIELKALAGDRKAIAEYESWSAGVLWNIYNRLWYDKSNPDLFGTRLYAKQAEAVMPHEYWNTGTYRWRAEQNADGSWTVKEPGNAWVNGFIFRSYCYNLGLTPRFSGLTIKEHKDKVTKQLVKARTYGDFTGEKGYWKTLIDRPMYTNAGEYRAQQKINMSEFAKTSTQAWLKPDAKATKEEREALEKDNRRHWQIPEGKDSAYPGAKEPNAERARNVAEEFLKELAQEKSAAEAELASERYTLVTDPDTLDALENGETMKVYRAMQIIDGKLYPPMAAKVADEPGGKRHLVEPTDLKKWYRSDERPELADDKGYFKLDKANDSNTVPARYNPYFHTASTPLNDQFTTAEERPNLVVVEAEIPVSELTSGYKAFKAKDAVGEVTWKAGPVASKLLGDKARKVYLSRWAKVLRIVPDAEVAKVIAETLDGEDVAIPRNRVTPSLRAELEKLGVEIAPADNERYSLTKEDFIRQYNERNGEGAAEADFTTEEQLRHAIEQEQQRLADEQESARAASTLQEQYRRQARDAIKAWEIYNKDRVRTLQREYRAKLNEQQRKAAEQAKADRAREREIAKAEKDVAILGQIMGSGRDLLEQKREYEAKLRDLKARQKEEQRQALEIQRAIDAVKQDDALLTERMAAGRKLAETKRANAERITQLKRQLRENSRQALATQREIADAEKYAAVLAEAMNQQKEAARRLRVTQEAYAQNRERRREQRILQRRPARAFLHTRRDLDARTRAIETEQGMIDTIRRNPAQRSAIERLQAAAKKLALLGNRLQRWFVDELAAVERFSHRQVSMLDAKIMAKALAVSGSTASTIYDDALVDMAGNRIGESLSDVLLIKDSRGKVDEARMALFQDYLLHRHNIDRMGFVSRAQERYDRHLANNPWLRDNDEEIARLVAMTDEEAERLGIRHQQEIAREFARLAQDLAEARDKPIFGIPRSDGQMVPVTAESSRRVVAEYEEQHPWLRERAEDLYGWWDTFMRNWVVGITMTEDEYADMRALYPAYVPTYRADKGALKGTGFTGMNGAGIGKVVKAATGSMAEVVNLEDSYANIIRKAIVAARGNALFQNIIDTLMLDTDGTFSDMGVFDWYADARTNAERAAVRDSLAIDGDIALTKAENLGLVKTADGAYRLTAWYDGETRSAYLSEDMAWAIQRLVKPMSETEKSLIKIGNWLTGPMKYFITGINPNFALRNVMRDLPTAIINSVSGLAFPKYWAQAAKEMAQRSENWEHFKALGGTNEAFFYDGGFIEGLRKKNGVRGKVGGALGAVNEATESVTRFAEYLATIDRMSADDEERARGGSLDVRLMGIQNAAEVTVDFSRRGSWGRVINAFVPYWNPQVQGVSKVFRSVFETKEGQALWKKAVKTLGRAAVTTVLPELLQYLILNALGRREDWEKLTDRMKDTYYCIPLADEHRFLKIPKNREWGAILGTPLMRMLEYANGRDNPFENYLETSFYPNFLPGGPGDAIGISQALELAENKDFAGRTIVPYGLQKGSKVEQYDENTSLIARGIAKALADMVELSPMQIDYIVSDYFGDFGDMLQKATSQATFDKLKDGTVDAQALGEWLWQTVSTPWLADNRYSNQGVSDYYDMVDRLERTVYDQRNHKTGDEPEDVKSREAQIKSAIEKLYGNEITDLNKEVRGMTDGPERDAVKERITDLAQSALEFYDQAMAGKYERPDLTAAYADRPGAISNELIRMDRYSKDYSFKPVVPSTAQYVDPSDKTKEYVLTQEQKDKRAELYYDNYDAILVKLITSQRYRKASDEKKAEMLAEARSQVTEKTREDLFAWLRKSGVKSTRRK